MYERMEKMKDVESMTLEGFFLADYQRMRQENDELRQQIAELSREDSSRYGVFDLGEPVDMVKVEVKSCYYFTGDYGLKDYTAEQVDSIRAKTNEELMNWAETFKIGDWSGTAIQVTEKRYRFSVRVTDMDGSKRYAFDPRHSCAVVSLDDQETEMVDNLDNWMPADMLDDLKKAALSEVRDHLYKAYEKKRKAEESQEDNAE